MSDWGIRAGKSLAEIARKQQDAVDLPDFIRNPYYCDGRVTLYHGDCREVLKIKQGRSVDAVITDPPFDARTHSMARSNNTAYKGNRALSGSSADKFAHLDHDDQIAVFTELGRITRGWVVANAATDTAFRFQQEPPEGLRVLRVGAWVKTNPMPSISADRPGMGWEAICYMHRDDAKPAWNGGGKHGNYVLPTEQGQGHPTAKPLVMVQDFVRRFTNPGDTILDPFAGSGTTLRAAVNEGRCAIGVEMDERYCEIIAKRMDQYALDFGGAA